MTKYVDLSGYWTEDKNLSIQKVKEMTGLDKRTGAARFCEVQKIGNIIYMIF